MSIMSGVYDEITKLLDEYYYDWSEYAINSIIDEWSNNKNDLIEAFKKHPNYVEGEYMIAFDTDYERKIDATVLNEFTYWLWNIPGRFREERNVANEKVIDLICELEKLTRNTEKTISKTEEERFKEAMRSKDIPIHAGAKRTRTVNKICSYYGIDKLSDYNKEFAKYADALNPMKITRHTVLSLHPCDYLTMSFGNSWSSCHTIDKDNRRCMPNGYEGQYSSGTMSYMLDESSIVFYTVDKAYDGTKYYTQPKITRQMFHYQNDKLIQGRLYPQSNDNASEQIYTQYRNIAQEVMSTCFDFPNFWTFSRGTSSIREHVTSCGTHYEDYFNFSNCTISTLKGSTNEVDVHIGHSPICIECGEWHDKEDSIDCCSSGYICSECGERVNDYDVIWICDEPYCPECVSYCDDCEEYFVSNTGHYVDETGEWVCEWCYEREYATCPDCGRTYIADHMYRTEDGRLICETCIEANYYICENCGAAVYCDDAREHEDNFYCEHCYDFCGFANDDTEEIFVKKEVGYDEAI